MYNNNGTKSAFATGDERKQRRFIPLNNLLKRDHKNRVKNYLERMESKEDPSYIANVPSIALKSKLAVSQLNEAVSNIQSKSFSRQKQTNAAGGQKKLQTIQNPILVTDQISPLNKRMATTTINETLKMSKSEVKTSRHQLYHASGANSSHMATRITQPTKPGRI